MLYQLSYTPNKGVRRERHRNATGMPAASYRIFAARQRLDALFVHALESLPCQPGCCRLRELGLYTLQ